MAFGHVRVAFHLTVVQELAYGPNSFASPRSGRLARRRRDRRVHADDTRLERPQHLAGAQRCVDDQSSSARQQQPAADQLGDAPGRVVDPGCVSTESERAVGDPARDRHERDEAEDALTG